MASSLALKKLLGSPSLLPSLSRAVRPVAPSLQPASRLFNTNALRDFDDDDDRIQDLDRRSDDSVLRRREFLRSPLSEIFEPFSTTRTLSQILNMADQLMDSPYLSGGLQRGWKAKETDDGLHLRVEMPGLGKEDVKVSVEQNTLIIKGEGKKEAGGEEGRRYTSRVELPEKLFKTDEIRAEMKNGVLKLVVPKVKEEERSDVFHVKVQ